MGYCIAGILGMFVSLVITVCVYGMFRSKESASKKESLPVSPEMLLSPEVKNELEHEIQSIQTIIGDLFERVEAKVKHIDEKEARLSVLVTQAESRMKELSEMMDRFSRERLQLDAELLNDAPELSDMPEIDVDQDQRISELMRQGMSLVEIAKTLGVGTGEVSLRLGLLQRKK